MCGWDGTLMITHSFVDLFSIRLSSGTRTTKSINGTAVLQDVNKFSKFSGCASCTVKCKKFSYSSILWMLHRMNRHPLSISCFGAFWLRRYELLRWLDHAMPLSVQRQVVGAREGACAVETAERFGSGVLANVSRQLVRTSKVPLTTRKVTTIRLLSYNRRVDHSHHISY